MSRLISFQLVRVSNDGALASPGSQTGWLSWHYPWGTDLTFPRSMLSSGSRDKMSAQRRLWSDWADMHGSRQFRQRESNSDNVFLWGERGSKKRAIIGPQAKRHLTIIGPPAKRHLNGVSLAGRRWPNMECWLCSFVIFQGIRTSIDKKPFIFVIFQGAPGPFPLWMRTWRLPRLIWVFTLRTHFVSCVMSWLVSKLLSVILFIQGIKRWSISATPAPTRMPNWLVSLALPKRHRQPDISSLPVAQRLE